MNWQHFRAILWLRWRLRVNQFKRAGTANAVILAILAGLAVLLGVTLFIALFATGWLVFRSEEAKPIILLFIGDGLVAGFLFVWAIGLLAELQRSEVLATEKFLHLPVSPTGVFLINYLSSLFSLTLLVFTAATLGLILGLAFARGPLLLLTVPLLLAFILMITALTYQFQGWLASLMVNQRRRRTVIVVATMTFVLLCQVPNLINIVKPFKNQQGKPNPQAALEEEKSAKLREADGVPGTGSEHLKRRQAIQNEYKVKEDKLRAKLQEENQQTWEQVQETAWVLNLVLPIGWLPLAAMRAMEGAVLPALLGTLGMTLIGAASLWRSYRTTLRLYTGQFTSGKKRAVSAPLPVATPASPPRLLEKELPWLSEQASAIALASFRSMTRAPEAKLVLMTPILMVLIFGSLLASQPDKVPAAMRPLIGFGAMAMILLSMIQLVGNQFGFDRSGFRVFVLCGAPRRDILVGKNVSIAPLALGLGWIVAAILQAVSPMRFDYFLSVFPQSICMFLLFCLVANCLSMLVPIPIAAGSMKPRNIKGLPLLLHIAFVFVFPVILAPALVPLGAELLLERLELVRGWPLCLLLSVVECVAVVYLYRAVVTWEGMLLHAREQKILEVVTSKTE